MRTWGAISISLLLGLGGALLLRHSRPVVLLRNGPNESFRLATVVPMFEGTEDSSFGFTGAGRRRRVA